MLYLAVLASMTMGINSLTRPFTGYVRISEEMQRGTFKYKGSELEKLVNKKPHLATLFPGVFFSTTILGYMAAFAGIFMGICIVCTPNFWLLFVNNWQLVVFVGFSLAMQSV